METTIGGGCIGTLGSVRPPGPVFGERDLWAVLDFPRSREVVKGPMYTLRISACERAERVDVRVDEGQWLPCRLAEGYWWYDWAGYRSGSHEVELRACDRRGCWGCSPHPRWIQVDLTPSRAD